MSSTNPEAYASLDAGRSMPEEPRFSKYGTKIITQAEMAALGELTDMLYLYGPDATRHMPAEE